MPLPTGSVSRCLSWKWKEQYSDSKASKKNEKLFHWLCSFWKWVGFNFTLSASKIRKKKWHYTRKNGTQIGLAAGCGGYLSGMLIKGSMFIFCIIYSHVLFQHWSVLVLRLFTNLPQRSGGRPSHWGHKSLWDFYHAGAVVYSSAPLLIHRLQQALLMPASFLSLQADSALHLLLSPDTPPSPQGPVAPLPHCGPCNSHRRHYSCHSWPVLTGLW